MRYLLRRNLDSSKALASVVALIALLLIASRLVRQASRRLALSTLTYVSDYKSFLLWSRRPVAVNPCKITYPNS
jgi:hypothetical protein